MKFGTRRADVDDSVENGEFTPYLRNFKPGETTVRFLEECDEWLMFWEHFTPEGKSFPCTQDRKSCPGCTSDNEKMAKASRKYATNLMLVENNAVLPWRIPVSLAKRLFNRSERNGTITNRDYVIMREGKGLDTEYDVEQDDKYPVDLPELLKQSIEIESVLRASYNELWSEEGQAVQKAEKEQKAREEAQESKPPFDTNEEIDEADLRKMDKADLIDLADRNGIIVDVDALKGEIIDQIIASA